MISIARPSVLRAARLQRYPSRATIYDARLSALARLLSTLAVLEQRDGKLQSSSLSAIVAAQKLGGSITGFVAGSGVKGTSAAEAAKIKGLDKIIAVENEAYDKVRISKPNWDFHNRIKRDITGTPGELRSFVGREHQEWWLYTCACWTFCLWQELAASGGCSVGCATGFRYHRH
jgi:hypothetical protein